MLGNRLLRAALGPPGFLAVIAVAAFALVSVNLWVAAAGQDARAPRQARSVILITVDSLRADHVSSNGYLRPTTPNLDFAAASQGVRFTTAYASASWTLPAIASLFTSLHPHQHGVEDRGARLDPAVPTLAGAFARAGFHTAAFTTHVYASSQFGLESGFQEFHEPGVDVSFQEGGQLRAEEMNALLLPWLAVHAAERLFLYAHYFDPHWDYTPPPPYDRRFANPRYKGKVDGSWRFLNRFLRPGRDMRPADLEQATALYDGEIAYLDHHLGVLFQELEDLGVWNDALVVVLADHGEELKDHGSLHHIRTLYDEVLRVPLLVKLPGGRPPGWRHTVRERVRAIDVAPTALELAGIAPPETFRGSSLVPLMRRPGAPRDAFARTRRHSSDLMALVHGRYKIVEPFGRRHGRPELYNLRDDPGEHRSIADANRGLRNALRGRLFGVAAVGPEALGLPRAAAAPALDEALKAKLRELGYVE